MKKILVVMLMFFVSFPVHAVMNQRSLYFAGAVVKGIASAVGLWIAVGGAVIEQAPGRYVPFPASERILPGLAGSVLLLASWRDSRQACKNDSDKKIAK